MILFSIGVGLVASIADAGLVQTEVETRYDSAPLPLDGRTIDFFPDGGLPHLQPTWLRIRGNRVLPEEMYRNALRFPPGTVPDLATAHYIEETLYGFLVKSGYELATVGAVVTKDGIDVQIDEGALEKAVFTGRLTFNTLRFRLELFIDQDIFNRPALERQIHALSKKIGLPVTRWSLIPTPNPNHVGPQIDSLGVIEGIQILHSRKRYELWFYFHEREWDIGPGLDLRSGYIDGLEVGLNYQGHGLFGDRWRVAASGGAGLRWRIDDNTLYPAFSRAYAEARWFSKALGPSRIGLWANGSFMQRQRPDLDVEDYKEAQATMSVLVAVKLGDRARITPSVGVEWRRAFDIVQSASFPETRLRPASNQRIRAFVELLSDWVIDPDNQRWDRQHKIELAARLFLGSSLDANEVFSPRFHGVGWLSERYQKVFEFGWHDLWIKSRARVLWGDLRFNDEESVGESLKGVFGSTFVRKGGNIGAEFRFSLNRDVLKLSLFTEVAAYGEVCRMDAMNPDEALGACRVTTRDEEIFRMGVSFGPGLHALIQGMFQLDLYATFGFRTRSEQLRDSPFSVGLVGYLNKTF